VHLDRYDPEVNPVLHLVDDAPLLLMISDTFMTLIMDTRRSEVRKTQDILTTQRFIWQEQVASGLVLGLVGFFIMENPAVVFRNIFELFIPLALICLAGIVLFRACRRGSPGRTSLLFQGTGIFCGGVLAYFLPLALWVVVLLAVLALWMIASAVMVLARVAKGRHAVPEGFYSRMAIGTLSLVLSILVGISPAAVLLSLMLILGAVTILLGVTLCINGLRLGWRMNRLPSG